MWRNQRMNEVSRNRILCLLIFTFFIYSIYTFYKQQIKLNKYNDELAYYETQVVELKEEQNELLNQKQNMDNASYIENIAREKLDMYYPNERVYIDVNK